jgi:hypothetical protein
MCAALRTLNTTQWVGTWLLGGSTRYGMSVTIGEPDLANCTLSGSAQGAVGTGSLMLTPTPTANMQAFRLGDVDVTPVGTLRYAYTPSMGCLADSGLSNQGFLNLMQVRVVCGLRV